MAERARTAHARAAHERVVAVEGDPNVHRNDDVKNEDDAPFHGGGNLQHAILAHEAAALVNLHAQAINVQNIWSLVSVVLDLDVGKYNRWRDKILLFIGKYSLERHILADLPAPEFPDWTCMDYVVKSWIFGTISADRAETALDRKDTARVAWLALETQFLGNRETRALHLNVHLHNSVQGDLTIADYHMQLKSIAQQLANLGEPISYRTLVLNVI